MAPQCMSGKSLMSCPVEKSLRTCGGLFQHCGTNKDRAHGFCLMEREKGVADNCSAFDEVHFISRVFDMI